MEVIEEFERRIGRPLNEGYGLSETSPVTHSTPHARAAQARHASACRSPTPTCKIVDVETGTREMPLGEAGELCICRAAGDEGLLEPARGNAPTSCAADADGRVWFHTGDVARMDEDGYTSIVQRKKDMIIVDGFNVYPSEVEAVLYTHPAVRMAAVIGVPGSVPRRSRAGLRRRSRRTRRDGG